MRDTPACFAAVMAAGTACSMRADRSARSSSAQESLRRRRSRYRCRITYAQRADVAAEFVDGIVTCGRRAIAIRPTAPAVRRSKRLEHTVAEYGRLDSLVSNAAEACAGPLDDFRRPGDRRHGGDERTRAVPRYPRRRSPHGTRRAFGRPCFKASARWADEVRCGLACAG